MRLFRRRKNPTEALRALGSTPQQVAASLRREGVKGSPLLPGACPLANYLRSEGFKYPRVGDRIHVGFGAREKEYALPPACRDFTWHFDSGHYPALFRR